MPRYRFDNVEFRRRRIASGKKTEQIALDVGVVKETIIAYEMGRAVPPTNRLLQLCDEVSCTPEDLLRPIDEMATP